MLPESRFLMAYCERLGAPAFWAEPLNALTNAGFLLAAALAFWLWRQRQPRDLAGLVLIGLIIAIGIGSFLFHTIPNRITVLLDVVPIQGFILLYLGVAIRRFLGAPLWLAMTGPLLFLGAAFVFVEAMGPTQPARQHRLCAGPAGPVRLRPRHGAPQPAGGRPAPGPVG